MSGTINIWGYREAKSNAGIFALLEKDGEMVFLNYIDDESKFTYLYQYGEEEFI